MIEETKKIIAEELVIPKLESQFEKDYHNRRASLSQQAQISPKIFNARLSPEQKYKKKISIGNTIKAGHRRIKTETQLNSNIIVRKPNEISNNNNKWPIEDKNYLYSNDEENKEKIQIIEALETPEENEEEKNEVDDQNNIREEKIKMQIKQAEEIISKFTKERIEDDSFNSQQSNKIGLNSQGENSLKVDETEKEIEVTVGDLPGNMAILITKECFIINWPIDMLPKDVKRGDKFSILVKRNENSEVLRENSIWTLQNQIISHLA